MPSPEVRLTWRECEQLNSAILKNNETKRKISKRLKNNSRQAERFKADLDGKVNEENRRLLHCVETLYDFMLLLDLPCDTNNYCLIESLSWNVMWYMWMGLKGRD